ncbi:MAG: hypothetical protein IPP99_22855 [Chitinophagaceae bacterium]|nr:hypothetical protein [Chitinophagaceae bacterium]
MFTQKNLIKYANLTTSHTKGLDKFSATKEQLGYYDFSPIDDSMNFASNLLDSVKTKPFRFVRGVLNKHNLSLLQNQTLNLNKNIIFTGKFTKQSGHLETKVDDCEVL